MTIFLPAASAAKLEIGGEARIILDPAPQYVIPASVSFVAADAQFTPKTVETAEEREKLMFRVKLKLDALVLKQFDRRVKTGVRGLGSCARMLRQRGRTTFKSSCLNDGRCSRSAHECVPPLRGDYRARRCHDRNPRTQDGRSDRA